METEALTASPPGPRFRALMRAVSALTEFPTQTDDAGLLIQAGPYQLRVLPEGDGDQRLVIEIELAHAKDAPASALALLHRVNHMARFHHGWQISLDEDDHIVLHTLRLTSALNAELMQDLMATGLERAAEVAGVWTQALALIEQNATIGMNNLDLNTGAVRA